METYVPYYSAELIAEKSWMIRNSFSDDTEALCYLVEGRDYSLLIDSILGAISAARLRNRSKVPLITWKKDLPWSG